MNARATVLLLAGAVSGAFATAFLTPGEADAAAVGDVLGTWNLRLRIDGWTADASASPNGAPKFAPGRGQVGAVMRLLPRDSQVNDGLLSVEITLDAAAAGSVLGRATPGSPNFRGVTAFLGDSMTAIDSGTPNYVNALNLRFDRHRRKVTGTWIASFPPAESGLQTQKFAAGVTADVTGRRSRRSEDRIVPTRR